MHLRNSTDKIQCSQVAIYAGGNNVNFPHVQMGSKLSAPIQKERCRKCFGQFNKTVCSMYNSSQKAQQYY